MNQRLRIVFFGDPTHEYSNRMFNYLMSHPQVSVVGVVASCPRSVSSHLWHRAMRRLRRLRDRLMRRRSTPSFIHMAAARSIESLQIRKIHTAAALDWLRARNADLFLCVAYPYILRRALYDLPPLGTVNIHPSLLPAYRGSHPVFWALRNGERSIGVTAFRVNDGIDTGPIIAQCRVPVLRGDTFWRAYVRIMQATQELLNCVIETARAGELVGVPQDESAATWFPPPRLSHYFLYTFRVMCSWFWP